MTLIQGALIRVTRGNHAVGRARTPSVQIPIDRVHQTGQGHRIRRLGGVRHSDGVHHRTPGLLKLLRAHILGYQDARRRLRRRHNRHRKTVALGQRGVRIRRHRCRYRHRIHHRVAINATDRLGITAAVRCTRRQRATRNAVALTIEAAAHLVVIQRRQDQVGVARIHHPDRIGDIAARLRDLTWRAGLL